jgi:uridine phosphorylase
MTVAQLQKFLKDCDPDAQIVVGARDRAFRICRTIKGEAVKTDAYRELSEWTGCLEDYEGKVEVVHL